MVTIDSSIKLKKKSTDNDPQFISTIKKYIGSQSHCFKLKRPMGKYLFYDSFDLYITI